jgi:hypothetical protein
MGSSIKGVWPLIPTWFVTIEVRKRGVLLKPRSPRETRAFATEAEAKIFARLTLDQGGFVAFAGTINPHSPRRLIPSVQVPAWLELDVPL